MAVYLLDTDHLTYIQKRHPTVIERLSALSSRDRVLTSIVGVAELLRGVYLLPKSRRQRELLALYGRILREMDEVLPLNQDVAQEFALIDARLRRKGMAIPINDVWVAALARVTSAVLVTNDEHFRRVDRLHLDNWTR